MSNDGKIKREIIIKYEKKAFQIWKALVVIL